MLHRVIYASEAVGVTGVSTLSVAQILGIAERNNRRDHITSCVMFHQGYILQIIEGARLDLDRLLKRLRVDPRHTSLRVLLDAQITTRAIEDAICLCGDALAMLQAVGLPCLSLMSANDAERLLDMRKAA